MADLIERDALVSLWKPIAERDCFAGNVVASCLNELNSQPAVDAVPVVRCGECERRVKSADLTDSVLCRWLHNLQMPKNGYCCYGERKG